MQDTYNPDNDPMILASRRNFQTRKQHEQAEILARFQGSELTWKQRYDRMKQHYSFTDAQIAAITGNSAGSVRTVVNTDQFPRWAKLAIYVFEMETGLNQGATLHL